MTISGNGDGSVFSPDYWLVVSCQAEHESYSERIKIRITSTRLSDRGVEFVGQEFQTVLKMYGLEHSVNRVGCCTDNAHMESFYHTLKTELIRGSMFGSLKELRSTIGQYINRFYNTVRLHSGINYQTPVEYEERLACN